jgi:SpoVK/Ycf46/Vps4 family AAA+-type ATPase
MSYFIRNGNTFKVADDESIDLHEHLPAGNYIVQESMMQGIYLEKVDSFEPIGRVYGDTLKNADRILSTFLDRKGKSTGVMLTGEKGSGKTLLARTLTIEAAKRWAIPTIIINSPWTGDKFNKLIQDIDQPCIVLFDEFEKVYDDEEQESILTLMDGVFPTEKLFVLTCNDKWRVDKHMRNRPGRIYYMLDFRGLEEKFIREYCEENLKDEYKQYTDKIVTVAHLFSEFNFDMLKAVVEEINRYGDTPQEAVKILNVKPEFDAGAMYDVKVWLKGVELKINHYSEYEGNPMSLEDFKVYCFDEAKVNERRRRDRLGTLDEAVSLDEDDENNTEGPNYQPLFQAHDLIKILPAKGEFEFKNRLGFTMTMTRRKYTQYHFDAF